MTTTAQDFYVVYDGEPDAGDHDPMAVAFPSSLLNDAKDTFNENIKEGLASKNDGLFLVRLLNVPEAKWEELCETDTLNKVVTGGFKGYNTEIVEQWKTGLTDWIPSSTEDDGEIPEGAVATDTGWAYEEESGNPYSA